LLLITLWLLVGVLAVDIMVARVVRAVCVQLLAQLAVVVL
jgi:hypothetical protein